MPDTLPAPTPGQGLLAAAPATRGSIKARRSRRRWVSPLMRRILLVNALPLALLVATLLYLNQFQNSLLEAEVTALREQARIYAGALGQSAVGQRAAGAVAAPHQHAPGRPRHSRAGTAPHQADAATTDTDDNTVLVSDLVRPLLLRLTEPSPSAQAKLFAPDGQEIADSRADAGSAGAPRVRTPEPGYGGTMERVYDRLLSLLPETRLRVAVLGANADPDAQPPDTGASDDAAGGDARQQLHIGDSDSSDTPPYIRRTADHRLLVTVAEPVMHDGHTVGIIQLTREARDVDRSLFAVRSSILVLFFVALALTVLLSWYLSLTIARPLLLLAGSAHVMREGIGRSGSVPRRLINRRDEIGELAKALDESARALWARMDAIERFAADVSHEIKNPLSSIRSAIETLLRIEDLNQQRRLLAIIGEDVRRLDRLITDISDASRVDAELSRARAEPVDVLPILSVLAEIHQATRNENGPLLEIQRNEPPTAAGGEASPAPGGVVVLAVEDRLVQVLRNLIGNAVSFSPPNGRILLATADAGAMVELSVSDEGPGIPEARLDSVFDRFYSERPPGENFGQHSGLGLSISRQIVEALRGSISAENRHDASGHVIGARFVVRLPKAP
ncbi:ATP-binding protein [Lichenicoccus roseus]|uniref:histidine kinase n=1 Tax=Lichenicoccus roseus TaxID=2683649 RepID=A0A5R9J838_9PROT|nr:ATP-binding protein [Lichenicoccus roseus]TLU71516.1 HAMP domain-containing protein [Lichenicoccus roseus]